MFDPQEYAALVFAIITINAWNRLAITNHTVVGSYQAGQHAAKLTPPAGPLSAHRPQGRVHEPTSSGGSFTVGGDHRG